MHSPTFPQFAQPEANEPDSVSAALEALRLAHDEKSADEACDKFLWSVGNNHAGTFYPVVLAALPEVRQILSEGGIWAQRAVLETLIDLGGSFVPEPGHETYLGAPVQQTLQAFIHALRPEVALLTSGTDVRADSARDLLELIDDQIL